MGGNCRVRLTPFSWKETYLDFYMPSTESRTCCRFLGWQLGRTIAVLLRGDAGPCQRRPLVLPVCRRLAGGTRAAVPLPAPLPEGVCGREQQTEVLERGFPGSGVGLLGDVGRVLSVPRRQDGRADTDWQRRARLDCADEKRAVRSYYQFKVCKLQAVVFTILSGPSF